MVELTSQRIYTNFLVSRTAPVSASHSPNASLRRSSIGRDTVRTPVSGGRSPIPTYEDKPLSASWAGSDFSDNHHWHVGKKLTDLEPISTPIPESGRDVLGL